MHRAPWSRVIFPAEKFRKEGITVSLRMFLLHSLAIFILFSQTKCWNNMMFFYNQWSCLNNWSASSFFGKKRKIKGNGAQLSKLSVKLVGHVQRFLFSFHIFMMYEYQIHPFYSRRHGATEQIFIKCLFLLFNTRTHQSLGPHYFLWDYSDLLILQPHSRSPYSLISSHLL